MVGIDIIEVDRIDKSEKFLEKIALEIEIEYINRSKCESLRFQRLASLFCVKEAVMKALGTGASKGVSFKDICLCHEDSGKPYVYLLGKAQEIFKQQYKDKKIEISISHTEKYATAIAVLI